MYFYIHIAMNWLQTAWPTNKKYMKTTNFKELEEDNFILNCPFSKIRIFQHALDQERHHLDVVHDPLVNYHRLPVPHLHGVVLHSADQVLIKGIFT